ncbi:hypothetical protein SDC9_88701 [bioreactor metagenome]|uniref:Uncharacterized protein n=1 Tax=bioreactor metagenome TaxID=1076179 RepID=A0A644ZM81_9ZZZZ
MNAVVIWVLLVNTVVEMFSSGNAAGTSKPVCQEVRALSEMANRFFPFASTTAAKLLGNAAVSATTWPLSAVHSDQLVPFSL